MSLIPFIFVTGLYCLLVARVESIELCL